MVKVYYCDWLGYIWMNAINQHGETVYARFDGVTDAGLPVWNNISYELPQPRTVLSADAFDEVLRMHQKAPLEDRKQSNRLGDNQ